MYTPANATVIIKLLIEIIIVAYVDLIIHTTIVIIVSSIYISIIISTSTHVVNKPNDIKTYFL